MSAFQDEIQLAIQRESSPDEFRDIVLRHKSYGLSQVEAYCTLRDLYHNLGCEEDDGAPMCETVEDVMDSIWGFCAESEKIWDEILSDEQVREFRLTDREE